MSDNILLSIIIPTKNRYSTLLPVICALCRYIKSDLVEFIIQDNSDDNSPYLDNSFKLNDIRIKYHYVKDPLSIKENTELAISKITGKYSIFIGDDDLLSPYILEVVEDMDKMGVGCLIYEAGYYWWDTVEFVHKDHYYRKSALWTKDMNYEFVTLESKNTLEFALENGGGGMFQLPRYYHGIVKTSALRNIKLNTGHYLNGSSPDMGFAISLALTMDKYMYVKYPVSIYGASKNSGGGWTASKKHHGKIEDQKHLPANIKEYWNEYIPEIWSETTIYAQTVGEILNSFSDNREINLSVFYATMMVYEPFLKERIKEKIDLAKKNGKFNRNTYLKAYLKKKLGKLNRSLRYKFKMNGIKVDIFTDVDKVMNSLHKNFKITR